MHANEPHYGCPKCGSPRFSSTRPLTEFSTQVVLCVFTSEGPCDEPEIEIDDYGDSDCYESQSGKMDERKMCRACGCEFTEPVFYPGGNTVEQIAARSGMSAAEIKPLAWIFETLSHAQTITVKQPPHATVIAAVPRVERRGSGRSGHRWNMYFCSRCGSEMDQARHSTRHVYRPIPDAPGRREKVIDARLLPVLIHAVLCTRCV